MSLDGLRAWIGVVERKLTMRTRVFLVLVAIAIGGAGTGIYLAVDAHDEAVSEADLQALRDELAGSAAETAGSDVTRLEIELRSLRDEVAALANEQGGSGSPQGTSGKEGGSGASQESANGVTPSPGDASEADSKEKTRLQELLDRAPDSESSEDAKK